MMLRHPGESPGMRLGEGCSSTATEPSTIIEFEAWNNAADRRSSNSIIVEGSAVP